MILNQVSLNQASHDGYQSSPYVQSIACVADTITCVSDLCCCIIEVFRVVMP